MGKDARLSFRISETMSNRIDRAVKDSGGVIRDRSEFGTKAIKFYLDYIENTESEEELLLKAILALANNVNAKGREYSEINQILKEKSHVPSTLYSRKMPDTHPDFDKLMGLLDQIDDEDMYKDLTTQLKDATYEDIPELYKKYSDSFFLSKTKQKQKIKVE